MEATIFNPIQVHLLKMFEIDKSQKGLDELKNLLYKYYSSKMESALEALWDSGDLDQSRLDEINEMDLHIVR